MYISNLRSETALAATSTPRSKGSRQTGGAVAGRVRGFDASRVHALEVCSCLRACTVSRAMAWTLCLVTLIGLARPAGAQPAAPSGLPLAEASQCESTKFLIGLRQQGLSFLQTEYMKMYPARGSAEQAWYRRETSLAKAIATDSIDGRIPLLVQADDEAAKAIEAEPDSPRCVLWRADRAQAWYSLAVRPLFEQAQFYGTTPELRRGLKESAERGEKAYDDAITAVDGYLAQMADAQSAAAAARSRQLNLSGFTLQRLLQFERSWITLCRALALGQGDVDQALLAGQVVRSLQDQHLVQDLDEPAPAQVEALLMAAIASRLQTDWPAAQGYLDATGKAIAAMASASAAPSTQWVAVAVGIERIRLQLDQGQFTQAIAAIGRQRGQIDSDPGIDPTARLARKVSLGMLDFEAHSLASDAAAVKKDRAAQASFADTRFDALAALAEEAGPARQGIYQLVGDRIGEPANVAGLPPFARIVCAARWIRDRKFDQALVAAESCDRDPSTRPDILKQDAIFFMAVCHQELKQTLPAAASYIRLARDYPRDSRAGAALLSGLSLLARQENVLEDASSRGLLLEVGDLLLKSGSAQVEQHKQAWLPLVAEANLREGRYDRAAELFQTVSPDGPQYGAAVVGRILALSGSLRFSSAKDKAKAAEDARRVIGEATRLAQKLLTPSATSPSAGPRSEGDDVLVARLLLEAARLSIDVLDDAEQAMRLLAGAEDRWKINPTLLAQLLSVRIMALQKTGRIEQTTDLFEQFMAVRPDAAGPLLASLLSDMQRQIELQRNSGQSEQAARHSALAAGLAEQLDRWAAAHREALTPEQRYAIRYRLARSLLQSEQATRALAIFEELYQDDAQRGGGQARDAGVLEGRATCLYDLGKWHQAREAYMDIWRRSQPRSPMWWQANLRALQCSAQLQDEDPGRILKVIRQHKDLYPDMGGPAMLKQFEELSFEMLKRIGASQASRPAAK